MARVKSEEITHRPREILGICLLLLRPPLTTRLQLFGVSGIRPLLLQLLAQDADALAWREDAFGNEAFFENIFNHPARPVLFDPAAQSRIARWQQLPAIGNSHFLPGKTVHISRPLPRPHIHRLFRHGRSASSGRSKWKSVINPMSGASRHGRIGLPPLNHPLGFYQCSATPSGSPPSSVPFLLLSSPSRWNRCWKRRTGR